ncbi:hypothetical protein ACFQBQ_00915 [Granulicella cerasi]|uniref:Glycoside hydrolase family 42 N-terminal domain-containing protein n=1 Tax=Granulicella cerasi TaxID=741063 RepID=A0ABW1Z422_9BACT|nr:hypothetical protein [Granulicella cerasi]
MSILRTNFREKDAPHLAKAAQQLGMQFAEAQKVADAIAAPPGDVVFWEAGGEFSDAQITQLQESVRLGANFILSLSRNSLKLPARLSAMLPTIGWGAQIGYIKSQNDRPIEAGSWDKSVFAQDEPQGLHLPYFFPIRPVSAVERGEGRYERFDRRIPKMDRTVKPHNDAWTRPLLNHDWQVRVSASDRAAQPLIVTGRYGAGRVVVLASSVIGFDAAPHAEAIWSALLRWVSEKRALPSAATAAETAAIKLSVASNGPHVTVQLENAGSSPAEVRVFARVLTWEGAMIGDVVPAKPAVTVPAGGKATVDLQLPRASSMGYQALDARESLQVRVAALSADESVVMAERRLSVDLEPALRVRLHTDSVGSIPTPFHKPDSKNFGAFRNRMGAAVGNYAYPPGATVNASVTVVNGLRNLAPFAAVVDLVDKTNQSVMALNDEATNYRKGPVDAINAWASWQGKGNSDNVLLFMFAKPVTVASFTIVGCDGSSVDGQEHNPLLAIVQFDDKEVLRAPLEDAFIAGHGQAYVPLKQPASVTKLTIRFPWVAAQPGKRRQAPWLGDIRISGWVGEAPPSAKETVEVTLENAMTGEKKSLLKQEVALDGGTRQSLKLQCKLPDDAELGFYRLTATAGRSHSSMPLLVTRGDKALKPITDIIPDDSAALGFIVTRGFRNVFNTGTGTAEIISGWGQPDDLVWAYSRQLKQIRQQARTASSRLYLSEDDMRHYSSPWKSFAGGQFFFDVATPLLVERMKAHPNWSKSPMVHLDFSDRWDTGPDTTALHGWQDYVEFDRHLRRSGKPGLKGKTRSQVGAEIHAEHEAEWQSWHLERYCTAVKGMRDAFAAEKKDLTIIAQGLPIVAGADAAAALAPTIRGMSDDSTWGMISDSSALTTGRQLGEIAFNPAWKVSTQGMWGYPSSVLNNEHWHSPVSTTEPSRRVMYDRAWRGMVWDDGSFRSVYTYGYNSNVGIAYTMNDNDWQQWWLMLERHSLLSPEAPLGAGLVVSSSFYADPAHVKFSCGDALEANELIPVYARAFEYLSNAGVPLAFGANLRTLDKWKGDAPLVLLNPAMFNEAEVANVAALQKRGVKIIAFGGGEGGAGIEAMKKLGVPLLAADPMSFNALDAMRLEPEITKALALPLQFPAGASGYGFRSGATSLVVVEDWWEKGRALQVRVRVQNPAAKSAQACGVNDHVAFDVKREGDFWVVNMPVRPADAEIIALREVA